MGTPVHIAILSDTHGMLRREVVAELQDCTHIIHAGDIIRETDLDELRLYGSVYAVRGNNDLWQDGLRDLAHILRFEIAGVSFLMTHDRYDIPRDAADFSRDEIISGLEDAMKAVNMEIPEYLRIR